MRSEICGNELNFLTYRLSIKGSITEKLLESEIFYNHFVKMKREGVHIDDALVYRELEKMLFPIVDEESRYIHGEDFRAQYVENYGEEAYKIMRRDCHLFKRVLSRLSEVLYGDSTHWKGDYEAEYGRPYIEPVFKPRGEVLDSRCGDELNFLKYKFSINGDLTAALLKSERFRERFLEIKKSGEEITDKLVYDELCKLLFPMLHYVGEHGEDTYSVSTRWERHLFSEALRGLSKALYSRTDYWKDDYRAMYGESCVIWTREHELNFLLCKLTLEKQLTIGKGFLARCLMSSDALYTHFVNIMRQCIHIDDALVYRELEKMLFPILHEARRSCHQDFKAEYIENYGKGAYGTMRKDCNLFERLLKKLSKVLYDDEEHWKRDYEDEYGESVVNLVAAEIPKENKDLAYLIEICDKLEPSSLKKMLTEELTVEAFRRAGKITDMRHAYEVFARVFFKITRSGYKNNPETSRTYYILRSVARDFCKALFAKENHWYKDYVAWKTDQADQTSAGGSGDP